MKYMENCSLMDALEQVKANNPPRFWPHTGRAIITGMVSGLEFIPSQRFIHPDL
jgi:hypothetical protein